MDRSPLNGVDIGLTRYPDPAVETLDPRFEAYVLPNAAVERLHTGSRWTEGPVWFGDGRYFVWSDIPNNRMLRWVEETGEVSVFRSPSNYSNGNTRDREGRLVSCEHGTRRVTRTEYDGGITVLMDSYQGKRLNAPNDVVVHPDGHVWFTDPGYGILRDYEGSRAEFELPTNVYRLDPESGEATVVTDELERPNGLSFSPDYTKLYITDTGAVFPQAVVAYDIENSATLVNRRVLCDTSPAAADGIRCDVDGNIWTSAGFAGEEYDGVQVFAPDGDLIGRIHLPETVSNLCFGGSKMNRLFVTASQSIYSLYVEARGIRL